MAKPLYEAIYDDLLNKIESGHFPSGSRLPTESELTEIYQVSRITVRRAMQELQQEGYVERTPGRGSFVRALEDKQEDDRPLQIGFILPDFSDSYGMDLVKGVEAATSDIGATFLLKRSGTHPEDESNAIRQLRESGCDGLVLMPQQNAYYNADLVRLILDQFPIVILDRGLPGLEAPCVQSNNEQICEEVVGKILDQGHENIAFVTNPLESALTLQQRHQGLIKAFRKRNKFWNEDLMLDSFPDSRDDLLFADRSRLELETIQNFLHRHPEITCILASEYHLAMQTSLACFRMGKKIPEDISLVGYDGPPTAWGNYWLTRITQPQELMGKKSVEILHKILQGKDYEMPRPFACELFEGTSFKSLV